MPDLLRPPAATRWPAITALSSGAIHWAADGWPLEQRGVVPSAPGLYFAGLAFQYAFASMLIGGAGRDAEYLAKRIASSQPARGRSRAEAVA